MKKYTKPMIMLERFELSNNIADCAWEMNDASDSNCIGKGDEGFGAIGNLFNSAPLCNITPDKIEGYCYQAGADGFNTWKS